MTIEIDYQLLEKELDRAKTKVFLGKTAAFLGSIMCSLNFSWITDHDTACTNGSILWWNPYWFLKLPPATRITVLLHELWHVAFMDAIRRGDRNPEIWNYACDYRINIILTDDGYTFEGTTYLYDPIYKGMSAEEIYDILLLKAEEELAILKKLFGSMDIIDPDSIYDVINKVVQAVTTANLSGSGNLPGDIEITLKRFLNPKLPWNQILYLFMSDLAEQDFKWNKPNRRYQDVYLPSLQEDNGLEHLIFYEDVSGSVTDGYMIRFNSEVKYIKETFNPKKLTLVQFDTRIQKEIVFLQDDPFEEIVIVGRGGTSLVCVRDHILEHEPTAAIIFSDLQVIPMEPIYPVIPLIWIAVNNKNATVPQGTLIHIKE